MRSVVIAAVVLVLSAGVATASAPPVGPLPKGPIATIAVAHGEVFAVVLPAAGGGGSVWRVARQYDGRVVNEVSEGVQRGRIVIVYRALHPGRTKIVYALTIGERTKALKARTFSVVVR